MGHAFDDAGAKWVGVAGERFVRNEEPATGVQWVIPAAATGLNGTYAMAYGYDPADHVTSTQYPADAAGGPGETVAAA